MGIFDGLFDRKPQPQPVPVLTETKSPSGLVTYVSNGEIRWSVRSVDDARRAVSDLKFRKRELAVAKRVVADQAQVVQADYTDQVRRRAPMMRGGGNAGRIVRGMQQAGHSGARRQLADLKRPLEAERRDLESQLTTIDEVLLKLESYIMSNP